MIKIIISLMAVLALNSAHADLLYGNWNSGQPKWHVGGICGAINANGGWKTGDCFWNSKHFACYNGKSWGLSLASTQVTVAWADPSNECKKLGTEFYFAAPQSIYENKQLAAAISASGYGEAWININKSGNYFSNTNAFAAQNPYIMTWFGPTAEFDEPDNGLPDTIAENCVAMDKKGYWHDLPCNESHQFLCFKTGTGWVLSAMSNRQTLAANKPDQSSLNTGVVACTDVGAEYTAPIDDTENKYAELKIGGLMGTNGKVWINVQDRLKEGEYVRNKEWNEASNATYWGRVTTYAQNGDGFYVTPEHTQQPDNGRLVPRAKAVPSLLTTSNEDCGRQYLGGDWFDMTCTQLAPFSCYDSIANEWALAPARYNENIYSGEGACQALDKTHRFHFAAPRRDNQQVDLAKKAGAVSVWVNATDRTAEGSWQYNQFLTFWAGATYNETSVTDTSTELTPEQPIADEDLDCAVAKGGSGALWYAEDCNQTYRFLCGNIDGTGWVQSEMAMVNTPEIAAAQCKKKSKYFIAPNSLAEQQAVATAMAAGTPSSPRILWVNTSDRQIEGEWKTNTLYGWAEGFPTTSGDCVTMVRGDAFVDGSWENVGCSSGGGRHYLCFNKTTEEWRLSPTAGNMEDFANGQNACEAMNGISNGLLNEYVFAAPEYLWQNAPALVAMGSNTRIWINGNDRIEADNWVFNQYLYWEGTALDLDGTTSTKEIEDCVIMNQDGHWQDVACDGTTGANTEGYKVACYSGDGWYLSSTKVNLSDFSAGQRACDDTGRGYAFFSPLNPSDNVELRALLASGEQVWLNAIDIAEDGKWVYNSSGLPTPNWAEGEPSHGVNGNCSYVDDNGLWYDADCTEERAVLCNDAGTFSLGAITSLAANFDAAHAACASASKGIFYSPTTFNENEQLQALLSGNTVWVNASDEYIETRWALNNAKTPTYPADSAVDSTNKCVSFDQLGNANVEACNQQKVVSCFDGQEWKLTSSTTALGDSAGDGNLISSAFALCQNEFGGYYTFAIPDASDTLAKWHLSQALSLSGRPSAWLNKANWFIADRFSNNMPYQNIQSSQVQTATGCAYVDGINPAWKIAQQCDTQQGHFACFNGASWKIAPANGTIDKPAIPQPYIDAWDQSYGDLRCREFFGQGYSFSAPITPREDADLQQALANFDNEEKNTWINYYAPRSWSVLTGQRWFADRINDTIIANNAIDQGKTTQDCGSVIINNNTIELHDDVCAELKPAVCFSGKDGWGTTTEAISWNNASAQCGQEFGEDHVFAIPRDSLEWDIVTQLSFSDAAWVNYSDISVESKWRANIPMRQWWADSEPSNQGNRDCVVMGGQGTLTAGQWRSDYCDQVFHQFACKRGTQWRVVGTEGTVDGMGGIWAQGFSACRNIADDAQTDALGAWHFDYPEDYFANLNVATTIIDPDNSDPALNAALENKTAWLNLTDQYREKDWQRGREFSEWAADFSFNDNQDCAFVDTQTSTINGSAVKGTWQPDVCYGAAPNAANPRQYACTNGLNWTLATVGNGSHWLDGFDACNKLLPEGSWAFAAPITSFDNERLKAAIGQGSAWINLQDVGLDGDWAANLSKPNLPPIIIFAAEDSNTKTNEQSVAEASAGHTLSYTVIDPEGGHVNVNISDANGHATINSGGAATGNCQKECPFTASYTAPSSANESKIIKLDVFATEVDVNGVDGKTTHAYYNVSTVPSVIAWFDFNKANNPGFDKTIYANHAIDDPQHPYDFPLWKNGALDFKDNVYSMTVLGQGLADAGLGTEYAVAFRIWDDEKDRSDKAVFELRFEASDGTSGTKCLGVASDNASGNNNIVMRPCAPNSSKWYQTLDGLIHNNSNPSMCISHPGDGNTLGSDLRSVQLRNCSGSTHTWNIQSDGRIQATKAGHTAYFIHADSANNNSNVRLIDGIDNTTSGTVPIRGWDPQSNSGDRGILQKGSGTTGQPVMALSGLDSRLNYQTNNDHSLSVDSLEAEQWVNVVMNVSASQMTLYIDGIKQAPVALTTNPAANNANFIVGKIAAAERTFIGQLDELQIFKRPLTDAEVLDVLPQPEIGTVQFETREIVRQEPQIEGYAQAVPVIVRRKDGSRGQLKARYRTVEGSAKADTTDDSILDTGTDFFGLNGGEHELIWLGDGHDEDLFLTPEYDLLPLLSAKSGEEIDSVELDRFSPVFVAIDLTVPATGEPDPFGIIWEQGGSGTGSLVGFNAAGELIIRAGDGAAGSSGTARLVVTASKVTRDLRGKKGTLFVEIDPRAGNRSVRAWFKENGLFGEDRIIYFGAGRAGNDFPSNAWQGGNDGRLGDINSSDPSMVLGEALSSPYMYNGVISSARFYSGTAPDPLERVIPKAKLAKLTLYNENPFTREPAERFSVELIDTEIREADTAAWGNYAAGVSSSLKETAMKLLDYTKNAYGILQFASNEYQCGEPYASDYDNQIALGGEIRYVRECRVTVNRLTGDQGNIKVSYGIQTNRATYRAYGGVTPTTDVVFGGTSSVPGFPDLTVFTDPTLSFAPGERSKTISFLVAAEVGVNNIYEFNESIKFTLFNPYNTDGSGNNPWLGDTTSTTVVMQDYAVGEISMEREKVTVYEPLFDDADASNNSVISSFFVTRSGGSNGATTARVTINANETTKGTDFDLVDGNGDVIAGNSVDLTWADGNMSSLPVYIKVYADKWQEVTFTTVTWESTDDGDEATVKADPCYDGGDSLNGLADSLDRDCSHGESFEVTLTKASGTAVLSQDKAASTVYIQDTTAPAVITFTDETLDFVNSPISESIRNAPVADVDHDGVFDSAKEGAAFDSTYDQRIKVKVTRSNSFAEHAVWLYVKGVAEGAAIAANFVGVNNSLAVGTRTPRSRDTHDAWMATGYVRGDGTPTDEYRLQWRMPKAANEAAATTETEYSVDIVIYDNNRPDPQDRRLEFRMEPASELDARVIDLGVAGSNVAEEKASIVITDENLPPTWRGAPSAVSRKFPLVRSIGNIDALASGIASAAPVLKNSLNYSYFHYFDGYNDGTATANQDLFALDQDWIDVNYSVTALTGLGGTQTSAGKYPRWNANYLAAGLTLTNKTKANLSGAWPYKDVVQELEITATDSEGESIVTTTTLTLEQPWRKIRVDDGNSLRCIYRSDNEVHTSAAACNDAETSEGAYWMVHKVNENQYQILNKGTGECLWKNTDTGGKVGLRTCEGGSGDTNATSKEYWKLYDTNKVTIFSGNWSLCDSSGVLHAQTSRAGCGWTSVQWHQ